MQNLEEINIKKVLMILFVILSVIVVFYGITVFLVKNKEDIKKEEEKQEVTIKDDEILLGSIFRQSEDSYYVLVELSSDYSTLYSAVYNYKNSGKLKLYIATLDDALNKNYYKEEDNYDGRIPVLSKTTLLKIENDSIVEHYNDIDEIENILTSN